MPEIAVGVMALAELAEPFVLKAFASLALSFGPSVHAGKPQTEVSEDKPA